VRVSAVQSTAETRLMRKVQDVRLKILELDFRLLQSSCKNCQITVV
jgi:hypothetical protein